MSEWPSLKIIRDKGGDYWSYDYDEGTSPGEQSETYVPLAALSSPEVIEAAARAEFEADGGEWESFDEASREEYREGQRVAMSAAIQALQGKEDHAA